MTQVVPTAATIAASAHDMYIIIRRFFDSGLYLLANIKTPLMLILNYFEALVFMLSYLDMKV